MFAVLTGLVLSILAGSPATASPVIRGDAVFEHYQKTYGRPARGGHLRTIILPVRGLDPHMVNGDATAWVTGLVYNSLLRLNQKGDRVLPDLAESWQRRDERTWVFRLRSGVRFQSVAPVNGRQLTSADVKYSLERMMGRFGKAGRFSHRHYLDGHVTSITTPDTRTVVIRTARPYAPLINFLASPWSAIVPREAVDHHGNLQNHAIGTGPFILDAYVPGSHLHFRRNPDFFRSGRPWLDRISFRISASPASNLSSWLAGKLDAMITYDFQIKTIREKTPDATLSALPGLHIWALRTPPVIPGKVPAKKPFNDVQVRRALVLAIDKPRLLRLAAGGAGEVQAGPIPHGQQPWGLPAGEQTPYDPARARKLLAAAGYPDGLDTELLTWNAPYMVKPAQIIQQMLLQAGIRVRLRILEMATYFNRVARHKYDLSLHVMAARADPQANLSSWFGAPGQSNSYSWPDPELQRMVYRQSSLFDQEKRRNLVHAIQRRVIDTAPMVFLYSQTRFMATRSWLHLRPYYESLQRLQAEDWWIDEKALQAAGRR